MDDTTKVSPERLTIDVDLSGLLNGMPRETTFAEFVADVAVTRLLEASGDGGEARREFRLRVEAITDEEIRKELKPLLAEGLTAAAQKTDPWGAPKGEPKTLREIIIATATAELTKGRERDYGRGQETIVQHLIRTEVERVVRADLQTAIHEAKEQVRTAVREEGARIITETIERVAAGRMP